MVDEPRSAQRAAGGDMGEKPSFIVMNSALVRPRPGPGWQARLLSRWLRAAALPLLPPLRPPSRLSPAARGTLTCPRSRPDARPSRRCLLSFHSMAPRSSSPSSQSSAPSKSGWRLRWPSCPRRRLLFSQTKATLTTCSRATSSRCAATKAFSRLAKKSTTVERTVLSDAWCTACAGLRQDRSAVVRGARAACCPGDCHLRRRARGGE